MSNGAFNPVVNSLFTIREVVDSQRSRSLVVVERLMKANGLNKSDLARRLDVTAGAAHVLVMPFLEPGRIAFHIGGGIIQCAIAWLIYDRLSQPPRVTD